MVMKTHFLNSVVMGLIVGFAVLGCSEKVETEEKKAVVEEEDPFSGNIAGVDPFSGNITEVDPFSGNKAADEEQVAKVAEVDPDPVEAIIADKLRSIIIPRIDFEDRTVEEAIDFIRLRGSEIDPPHPDPTMRGLSVVIRRPKNASAPEASGDANDDLLDDQITSARIPELRLRNVPVTTALRYICIMTNLRCEVDECLVISPKVPNTAWDDVGSLLDEKGDTTFISQKLSHIRLPRVDFENTSIHEAIDFLRLRSVELDVSSIDTGRKGINFVVYIPKEMESPYIDKLQMRDASFEEVLKEICAKTGMRYELDPYSVILVPKDLK
jgi:hypothetical protein